MDIGMNLAGVSYFATEEPFIDRFKTAGAWIATNNSGGDVTSKVEFNSQGYPIHLHGATKLNIAVGVDPISASPTDQYILTWSGAATIKLSHGEIVSSAPGKIVFNYDGGDQNPYVYLGLSGLTDSNPVRNMHVVRADQVDLFNAGEIFNPELITKTSQWSAIRFMDWENTNESATVSWTGRAKLDDMTWSKGAGADGVPLEAMVRLANEAHVDMWYVVPTKAEDSFVEAALTYIRDNLDPSLKVDVEYSNEVWNKTFSAYDYAQAKANAKWGVDSNKDGKITGSEVVGHGSNLYYGYRSAQIASIAHKVFGTSGAERLNDVISGQSSNSGVLTYILQGVEKAGKGAVADLFDSYAVAPYFGDQFSYGGSNTTDRASILAWARSGAAGINAAFNELEFGGALSTNSSLAAVNNELAASETAAKNAGLDLVAYEGGASLYANKFPGAYQDEVEAFFGKLIEDPRMGALYTKLLNDFSAHGGTEFLAFNDASDSASSGNWGALTSIYDDTSARYEALLAARPTTPPPPAPGNPAPGNPAPGNPTEGDDVLHAKSAGGSLAGLGGNDILYAGNSNDTVDGGAGNDMIVGSSGTTDAKGTLIEEDYYQGGAGADTIVGGAGNDHIYGFATTKAAVNGDGNDSLSGMGGNDYISGDQGNDWIDGGDGNDKLYGGDGNDTIKGSAGNDTIQADSGNDSLLGGTGNDVIHGNQGDDAISGGDGDDKIFGEGGRDLLSGGAGKDIFSFIAKDAALVTTGTLAYLSDEITDFTHGSDKIDLGFHVSGVAHGAASTVALAATWAVQTLLGHAGSSEVAAVSVGSDTYLFYDDAGKGGAMDSLIKLDAVSGASIDATDFL